MKIKPMKLRVTKQQRKNKDGIITWKLFHLFSSSLVAVMITSLLSMAGPVSATVLVDTGIPFSKGFSGSSIKSGEAAVDDFQVPVATTISRVELLMFVTAFPGADPIIRVQITDAIGPGSTVENLIAEFTATVGNPINVGLVHYVSIPMNLPLPAGTYYLVVSSDVAAGGKYANWVIHAPNGTPGQGMLSKPALPYSFTDSAFPPASQFFDILPAMNYSFRVITEDVNTLPVANDSRSKMYFSNLGNDTILRANIDGTGMETLVTGQHYVLATAVDADAGKLYWSELQLGIPATCCAGTITPGHWASIKRSNLDGSDVRVILTKGHGVKHPSDIKLDLTAGKLYWADGGDISNGGRIYRANLDGSNVELLVDVISLRAPDFSQATGFEFAQVSGLALDINAGQYYWTDYFAGDIHRAFLDGSGIEQLVTGLKTARGIDLDLTNGNMYWVTGDFGNEVMRGNMNGAWTEIIVNKNLGARLKQPFNVALDVASGRVYWTDMDTGKIQRSDLTGLGVVTLVELGVFRKGKFRADSIAGLSLNLVDTPLVTGPASADLGIGVISTSNTITAGGSVTYTLTVTNSGPNQATGVVLTDNLTASAVIVSTSANCNTVSNTVTCTIGNLAQGTSVSADITVTSGAAGILSNNVSVTGIQADPVLTNNTVTFDTAVNPSVSAGVGGADLVAEITKLRSKTKNGLMNVEMEVNIHNTGSTGTGMGFTATAFFSSDAILDAGDTLLQTWNIGALAPADSAVAKTRNSLLPAQGWIIVVVDREGIIDESDENNNQTDMPL